MVVRHVTRLKVAPNITDPISTKQPVSSLMCIMDGLLFVHETLDAFEIPDKCC